MQGRSLLLIGLTVALLAQFPTTVASAHERREVADSYLFVVGSLNEPLVAGYMNGIDLRISSVQSSQPVEGAHENLRGELIMGDHSRSVALAARPGLPGYYTAPFIPTQDGSIVFRFHGTIEGAPIDEQFDVRVRAAAELQFP